MQELTKDQIGTIRRLHGTRSAKDLARELKVPRKAVEQALEGIGTALPVWSGREPRWWAFAGVLLVLLAGYLAYRGNYTCGFHFDDAHTIQNNDAIRTLRTKQEDLARSDDSLVRRIRNFRRALVATAEKIYAYNKFRMVTYWSFALNEYAHGLKAELPGPEAYPFQSKPHWGWHWTNNIIHLLNGALVFWISLLTLTAPVFTRSRRAVATPTLVALLAAAVFLLHPLQTQSVTYLSQRTESLCATFYLLTLALFITARLRALGPDRGSAPWMTPTVLGAGALAFGGLAGLARLAGLDLVPFVWMTAGLGAAVIGALVYLVKTGRDERLHAAVVFGAFLTFGLGLQTKEVAATIPFAVVLWDLFFVPRTGSAGATGRPWALRALGGLRGERLRYLAPWAALIVMMVVLGLLYAQMSISLHLLADVKAGGRGAEALTAGQYLATQANVVHNYLRLFVLPAGLHLDHSFPRAPSAVVTIFSTLVILAAVGLSLWRGGRGRVPAFAVLFGLLVLAPSSSLIVLPDVMYEHRVYLPLAGAALALAVVVERLLRLVLPRERMPLALWGLVGLVCVGLGTACHLRNQVWQDEVTLWRDNTEKAPDKPRPWTNLGLAYQNQEPHAVKLVPEGQYWWGEVRELPGDYLLVQQSGYLTEKPLVRKKGTLEVEDRVGGSELARVAYERSLELDEDYVKALNNLALISVFRRHNRLQENQILRQAIASYQRQGRRDLVKACGDRIQENRQEADELFRVAENAFLKIVALGRDDHLTQSNLANLYLTAVPPRFIEGRKWLEISLHRTREGNNPPALGYAIAGDSYLQHGLQAWQEGKKDQALGLFALARQRYTTYLEKALRGRFRQRIVQRRKLVSAYVKGQAPKPGDLREDDPLGHGHQKRPPKGP